MKVALEQLFSGIAIINRAFIGDFRKFRGNYFLGSNFFKVAFSHGLFFMIFAQFSGQLRKSMLEFWR